MINVLNKLEMLILDFDEDDLPPIPPLEDDEEGKLKPKGTFSERPKLISPTPPPPPPPPPPQKKRKTGTELKTLTSKKLLARLPTLLAEIKARNNSSKLIEIRKRLYPFH